MISKVRMVRGNLHRRHLWIVATKVWAVARIHIRMIRWGRHGAWDHRRIGLIVMHKLIRTWCITRNHGGHPHFMKWRKHMHPRRHTCLVIFSKTWWLSWKHIKLLVYHKVSRLFWVFIFIVIIIIAATLIFVLDFLIFIWMMSFFFFFFFLPSFEFLTFLIYFNFFIRITFSFSLVLITLRIIYVFNCLIHNIMLL